MSEIQVTRLPKTVKMPKLVHQFRPILKRGGLPLNFWITELADTRGTELKEAKIRFPSHEEAVQAVKIFHNYKYSYAADKHVYLNATLLGKGRRNSPSPYRSRSPYCSRSRSRGGSYGGRYSPIRNRSRSPLYREKSKLDLELELLRKKRLLIEEERRLLLEQKKLEMIREFGPSASREFEGRERERSRERRQRPKRERPVLPRDSPPRRLRTKPVGSDKLPRFHMPCRILIGQMKPIIQKHVKPGEKKMLDMLTRTELRKRLAIALENSEYLPAEKIVDLYRSKHSVSSDEAFITTLLKNVRVSYWNLPKENADGKVAGEKINETKDKTVKAQVDPDSSTAPLDVKKESDPVPDSEAAVKVELVVTDSSTAPSSVVKKDSDPVPDPEVAVKVEMVAKEEANVTVEQVPSDTTVDQVESALLEDAEDWIQDGDDWNDGESEEGQETITPA